MDSKNSLDISGAGRIDNSNLIEMDVNSGKIEEDIRIFKENLEEDYKNKLRKRVFVFLSLLILVLFSVSIVYTNADMDKRIKSVEENSNLVVEKKDALLERIILIESENNKLKEALNQSISAKKEPLDTGTEYDSEELQSLLEEEAALEAQLNALQQSSGSSDAEGSYSYTPIKTSTTKKTTTTSGSQNTQGSTNTASPQAPAQTPEPSPSPEPTPAPAPTPTPTPAPTPTPTPPPTTAAS